MEEANKKKRVKRKETAEKTEKKAKRKDRVGKVRRPVSRVAAAKEEASPEIGQLMQSLGLQLTDNNQLTERVEEQPAAVAAAEEQEAPAKEQQPQPARDPTFSDHLRTIVHNRLGALCEESTRSAGEHNERVMSMVQRTMRNAAEKGGCECTFECGRDPHVLEPYLKAQRIGFCYNSFEKVYLLYWHKGL